MSHGLPDYYRGVDIAYQALSEIIIRPKYGAAEEAAGFTACAVGENTTLVSITGRGVTYGGYIWVNHDESCAGDIYMLKTEGETIFYVTPESLNMFNFVRPAASALFLCCYDAVNYMYAVAIAPGITFETGLAIVYHAAGASAPDVNYNICYALI